MTHRDSRLPFTILIPDSRRHPIEVHDHSVALRMAIVEKDSVRLLDDAWDCPGAYVLLGQMNGDRGYAVYVGKAPTGLKSRLLTHERQKEWWARALLIQRGDYNGLTSAQAGWLEGDLYDLFLAAESASLTNTQKPGDDTVPTYELRILESFRDPITRVLRLMGYDPQSAPDEPVQSMRKKNRYFGVKFSELVDAGLIRPGERLISTKASWPGSAEVTADGQIAVDGKRFAAPSPAACELTGQAAVPGWDFWAVERADGSVLLSVLRKQFQSARQAADTPS